MLHIDSEMNEWTNGCSTFPVLAYTWTLIEPRINKIIFVLSCSVKYFKNFSGCVGGVWHVDCLVGVCGGGNVFIKTGLIIFLNSRLSYPRVFNTKLTDSK